ncbi:uncharacterized [Tachysurus ichikawai]
MHTINLHTDGGLNGGGLARAVTGTGRALNRSRREQSEGKRHRGKVFCCALIQLATEPPARRRHGAKRQRDG